jgi:acetolactate synthase-1/2/3 large subunit
MKVSDYIVDFLIQKGVTDVFGVPGGVVLDFLDSLSKRENEIREHFGYHEQASAFAAHGYAQASGKLGVAYATKGPGILNLVTGIATAFHESNPTLFIVGHSEVSPEETRFSGKQEVDSARLVKGIVKYYARIDRAEDVVFELTKAYYLATNERPGPVLLDIKASVFRSDLDLARAKRYEPEAKRDNSGDYLADIFQAISKAERPVILIGAGVRSSKQIENVKSLVKKLSIPALSSRGSLDILLNEPLYYGHIGSHGLAQAHFILSKADLVVSLGNRLSYPSASKTWADFFNIRRVIRVDIDDSELKRQTANNETKIKADLFAIIPRMLEGAKDFDGDRFIAWRGVCDRLADALELYENGYPVTALRRILSNSDLAATIDAGENELWALNAIVANRNADRALFSGNLEAVGSSLPTAIGVFYALRRPVYALMGDHGFGFNMQELQFIKNENLPIIIIINNNSSMGALRTEQKSKFDGKVYHTTRKSGYKPMDFSKIAGAFEFAYTKIDAASDLSKLDINANCPQIIEVVIAEDQTPKRRLPFGNNMRDFTPPIDRKLYEEMDRL